MKPRLGMLALSAIAALGAVAALAGCRDDAASTTSTTSHVVLADPTAGDQSNDPRDLALAGEIRRTMVMDGRLSMRAKSAVVVVRDGVVIVRGDLASKADHDQLVARIVSVPGVVRIDDRTSIANAPNGEAR